MTFNAAAPSSACLLCALLFGLSLRDVRAGMGDGCISTIRHAQLAGELIQDFLPTFFRLPMHVSALARPRQQILYIRDK